MIDDSVSSLSMLYPGGLFEFKPSKLNTQVRSYFAGKDTSSSSKSGDCSLLVALLRPLDGDTAGTETRSMEPSGRWEVGGGLSNWRYTLFTPLA